MTPITITQPDDWHVHLRDGAALAMTVPHAAQRFGRVCAMPNLNKPVHSPADAKAYLDRIQAAIPAGATFTPLLSLYLNEHSQTDWVRAAHEASHLLAFKYYPKGATTRSESGVPSAEVIYPILEAMQTHNVPLQVHGEVTDAGVDIFDREKVFIDRVLGPMIKQFPGLRIVLEHITTRDAVDFVRDQGDRIAATITSHHLLLNRNDLLVGGIKPHHYCLPILKRKNHQAALLDAATSGESCFFLGSDSAPHARNQKESACGCAGIYTGNAGIEWYATAFDQAGKLDRLNDFASQFGATFYQLPVNTNNITLIKQDWTIPGRYAFGDGDCIPLRAGQICSWVLK